MESKSTVISDLLAAFGAIVYCVLCALCVCVPCAMCRRHITHTIRHTHSNGTYTSHGTYKSHIHGAQILSTHHTNTNTVLAHSNPYNTLHTTELTRTESIQHILTAHSIHKHTSTHSVQHIKTAHAQTTPKEATHKHGTREGAHSGTQHTQHSTHTRRIHSTYTDYTAYGIYTLHIHTAYTTRYIHTTSIRHKGHSHTLYMHERCMPPGKAARPILTRYSLVPHFQSTLLHPSATCAYTQKA